MKKPIRNYLKLVNELIDYNIPFKVGIAGYVSYFKQVYPILYLENIIKNRPYHVVIQAGIHGNEAIGVHVLMNWLRDFKSKWLKYYNFTIFPCMNPYGYTHNCRRNGSRQQVSNERFWTQNKKIKELNILAKHYPSTIDLFIDLHADTGKYGKSEIYIYERRPLDKVSIAQLALKENKKIIPYVKNDTVYGEKCVDGVIVAPEHDKSIDDRMGNLGVPFVLTVEIPGKIIGRTQLAGGVKILNSLLKFFIRVMGGYNGKS